MQVNTLKLGIGLAAGAIVSAETLDVLIDRSNHDHENWAYRYGSVPTKPLLYGGAAAVAVGLGAKLLPATRGASSPLLRIGAAALGAWGATFAVRLGVGMLFSPHDGGLKWNPGDITENAIDRTHMMSRESHWHERVIFNAVSQLQGHGTLDERTARGDFEPIWPK